jgi:hypothetical protein
VLEATSKIERTRDDDIYGWGSPSQRLSPFSQPLTAAAAYRPGSELKVQAQIKSVASLGQKQELKCRPSSIFLETKNVSFPRSFFFLQTEKIMQSALVNKSKQLKGSFSSIRDELCRGGSSTCPS